MLMIFYSHNSIILDSTEIRTTAGQLTSLRSPALPFTVRFSGKMKKTFVYKHIPAPLPTPPDHSLVSYGKRRSRLVLGFWSNNWGPPGLYKYHAIYRAGDPPADLEYDDLVRELVLITWS